MRLSVGGSDTIVVNNQQPTLLPVRALDAAGREVAGAPIRFARADGASLPVTETGTVSCSRRGDFEVNAALGELTTRVVVRCRPVEYVRIPGPLQFVLGDSELSRPRELPIEAYDSYGQPVALVGGYAEVGDTSVAVLRGLMLYPRKRGITGTLARIGDRSAMMGVHIYQGVETLTALDTVMRLDPTQRLVAIPLTLARGEFHRQRLPRGSWMLAMLPEDDSSNGIRLRVEGADCTPNFLNTPRRFGCHAGPNAVLIVYRSLGKGGPSVARSNLLVRWLFT